MAQSSFLAFDLGAESGRAMLGRLEGGRLALEEKHRFANPRGRINGHWHWDLLAQWEQIKEGLRKTALEGVRLDGVGVDTWGVDFGLIASTGEVVGNPYMYRDGRTDGMMDRAFARVGREEIFKATGIQFMQLNTLYQLLAMREAKSPLLDAAQTLLFMPDLFHHLLCGSRVSEWSIASTSQMYDPVRRMWAVEMLKRLDLPTRVLPEIVPSGTVLGDLRADVSEECGIAACVIAPGCHDTASAVAAVPAEGDGWCYISSGTWSLMGVEIDKPIINDKSLKYNYTNEGGVGGRIRFLKNIMGLWPVQECRREWAAKGREYGYGELTDLAAKAQPFVSLVNLDHGPILAPGDMPGKIQRYCKRTGQQPPAEPGEFVRACLESLALTYRATLEGLEDILGRKIGVIHIVGGGCRNGLLNQMTADACDRPVIAGPDEATAAGNVLVQAMALGKVSSLEALRAVVRSSFATTRYQPVDARAWEAAYGRFRSLAP